MFRSPALTVVGGDLLCTEVNQPSTDDSSVGDTGSADSNTAA
jgi:hypothetical protein